MNILLIGDPHFKNNNTSETDIFVQETLKYVEENKDNLAFIVILGDVLHTHEKIHLQPLCRATKFIKSLASLKYTFVLVGNHDRINNKVFLTEEHSLIGLKGQENIQIVDKVKKFRQFLFVPYVEPGRFQEAIDTSNVDLKDIKAIFAHQEFKGVKMKNIVSLDGDEWSNENPPVFTGHIHNYQQVNNNIFYIGTPYQLNYGESEDKALAILEINKDNFSLKRHHLNFIKKKTITLKASDLETLELNSECHWRIIIEDDIKCIKKILNLPNVREKVKDCQLNFKLTNQEIKRENIDKIENSFDKILEKNINNLNNEEQEFYNSIVKN